MDAELRRLEREAAAGDPEALVGLASLHERLGRPLQAYLLFWYAGVDRPELGERLGESQTKTLRAINSWDMPVRIASGGTRRGRDPWDVDWEWRDSQQGSDRPVLALDGGWRLWARRLECVTRLQSLVALDLGNCKFPHQDLALLERLPFLTWLKVGDSRLDDDGLRSVSRLRSLRGLDLSLKLVPPIRFTNQGLAALGELPHLRALNLQSNREITDAELEALTNLGGLRRLNVRGCSQLTDMGLVSLGQLDALRDVLIDTGSGFTAAGVRRLVNSIPGLRVELPSSKTCPDCARVSVSGESGFGFGGGEPASFEYVHNERDGRDWYAIARCASCSTYFEISYGDDQIYPSYDRKRVPLEKALKVLTPTEAAKERRWLAELEDLQAACGLKASRSEP